MLFNIYYRYLRAQTFTPNLKYKLRIFYAKDQRFFRPELNQFMHQVSGAQWGSVIQNIAVDGYIIKTINKLFIAIIMVGFGIYVW